MKGIVPDLQSGRENVIATGMEIEIEEIQEGMMTIIGIGEKDQVGVKEGNKMKI